MQGFQGVLVVLVVVGVLLGAVFYLRAERPAETAPSSSSPAPKTPAVLPGDHTKTPLFPAFDPKTNRWGYIDASGRFVIAPQYLGAEDFSEGLAFIFDGKQQVCIDKNNKERFKLQAPGVTGSVFAEGVFEGGFALVVASLPEGNRYTYVDTQGRVLGLPRFSPAMPFSEGLAAVGLKGVLGFIGPDGEFKIKPEFNDVESFKEGLAPVTPKDAKKGRGRTRYITLAGAQAFKPTFCLGKAFGDGLAPVQPKCFELDEWMSGDETTDYGYIDKTGKMVIPQKFRNAFPFLEGRARVEMVDPHDRPKWGFIDTSGKFAVPAVYEMAEDFSGGMAAVEKGGLWGFVDRSGKLAISPRFVGSGRFKDDLALVHQRPGLGENMTGREGYVDKAGNWIYFWPWEEPMHISPAPELPEPREKPVPAPPPLPKK